MPKLQISIPNVGDVTHELAADEITIGRGPDNKIQIKDASVSHNHARLVKTEGNYQLEDLGSTNGTFCNGNQFQKKTLDDSAALRFGNIAAYFHKDVAPRADDVMKSEIRKLRSQLASVREARDLVHARNQELLKERDEASLATDIARAELAEIKAGPDQEPGVDPEQIQQLEKRIEEQRTQVVKLVEERKNFEKQLQENEAAKSAQTETVRQLEEKSGELERLREAEGAVRRELTEQQEKAQALSAERDGISGELEKARQELSSAQARTEEQTKILQTQLDELRQQHTALEGAGQQAIQASQIAAQEIADLREKERSLTRKLDAVQTGHEAEGDRVMHEKTCLINELEELKTRNATLTTELDQARSMAAGEGQSMDVTMQGLRTELAAAKESSAHAEGAKGKIESELKSRLTELELARGELQANLDARKGDLEERGRRIVALEAEKHALEQQLAHQHETVSSTKSEADKAMGELRHLRQGIDETRKQGELISKERDTLRRQQQNLMGQLDEQKAAHAATSENSNGLEAEVQKLRAELETLRTAAAGSGDRSTRLDVELKTLRESLAAIEKERDEESRRADAAQQTLRESEKERKLVGTNAAAVQARLAETEAQLEGRTVEIESLRQQIEKLEAEAAARAGLLDDPFANGQEVKAPETKSDGASGMRSRRTIGKIDQRLRHRSDEAAKLAQGETAVATEALPRWIGRKLRPNPRPVGEEGVPVFPEDVVTQDCVTLSKLPEMIGQARTDLQYLIRHPNDAKALEKLISRTHEMSDLARTTVFQAVYNMSSALDSLLADLRSTPERINQATLRTVTQSLDFMNTLVQPDRMNQTLTLSEPHVLVIDDELDIIEAIVGAMELVGLSTSGSSDPQTALDELGKAKYDLVFLDVKLPEITGWDLCQKIRSIPEQRRTPIIFVTGLSSIENKVKSTLQGGNDFVGKPFNVREIGIKALSWVYRGQLGMI